MNAISQRHSQDEIKYAIFLKPLVHAPFSDACHVNPLPQRLFNDPPYPIFRYFSLHSSAPCWPNAAPDSPRAAAAKCAGAAFCGGSRQGLRNRTRCDGKAARCDAAFDAGLVSVAPGGAVISSPRLSAEALLTLGWRDTISVKLSGEHEPYLRWHRERVFQRNGN